MSIRIDAAGDYLRRTASLPSDTLFTILGYAYIVSARTGNFRYILGIDNAGATDAKFFGWNDIDQFATGSISGSIEVFSAQPTTGKWFCFALTCNGTGAGSLKGYWRYLLPSDGTTIYTTSGSSGAFTESALYLGTNSLGGYENLRLASLKVWDAVLTQAQIVAEWSRYRPVITASLHAWWPGFAGATERLRDYSGNGKTLTAGGTLTDEAGPPAPWGFHGGQSWSVPAAAGSSTLTVADVAHAHSLDASGALFQNHFLSVAEISHAHSLDAFALMQDQFLAVADIDHAHALDVVGVLVQAHLLNPADVDHAHTLDAAGVLFQDHFLVVADASHAHAIDAVVLSQIHNLITADVSHAHALDSVVLVYSGTSTLSVADILHGHTLDTVVLSQVHNLITADISHAHALDTLAMTQVHNLTGIADIAHAHSLDAVGALVQTHNLILADIAHGHALDAAALSQVHNLIVADIAHAHGLDSVVLIYLTIGAAIYAVTVNCNITPTVSLYANITPVVSLNSNPSPSVEVKSG